MSLNNIQLQDLVVGELYKDALLVSSDGAPVSPSAPVSRRPVSPSAPVPEDLPPAAKPIAGASLAAIAAAMSPGSPAASTVPQPAATPSQPAAAPPQSAAPATPPASATSPSAPYKVLGNHRRKITILVNAPGSPFLPDNQLNFLTKILEACRLNMGDVAIVNHASAPINITALRAQLQPSVILLFGLEPTTIRLPINFPVFKLQPYDQCTYLSAPALDLLVESSEESRLLKSKLWVCLKSLFDV